ncbi:hypothetical protein ES702_02570 [subsurface metagenome]
MNVRMLAGIIGIASVFCAMAVYVYMHFAGVLA